jgi:hypothetical protein
MQIRCSVFQRLSSNVYQPTIIRNLEFNFCEMMKNNETLYFATRMILPVYPPLAEMFIRYKAYIHPCPYLPVYSKTISIVNAAISHTIFFSPQGPYIITELIEELILTFDWPPVDGKVDCRCSDKNDHTVANVGLYVAVKRGAPFG